MSQRVSHMPVRVFERRKKDPSVVCGVHGGPNMACACTTSVTHVTRTCIRLKRSSKRRWADIVTSRQLLDFGPTLRYRGHTRLTVSLLSPASARVARVDDAVTLAALGSLHGSGCASVSRSLQVGSHQQQVQILSPTPRAKRRRPQISLKRS